MHEVCCVANCSDKLQGSVSSDNGVNGAVVSEQLHYNVDLSGGQVDRFFYFYQWIVSLVSLSFCDNLL